MGKLRSNRVKRLPQTGITSDRYEFLGLNQAEPNLGDPKVGPSSVGVNPIKAGAFYQLAAIGEYPGERYWSTQVGIGSTLGVISVYANDLLPSSAFERIHGLNFVGTGVTLETPPLELFDGIGIATIRFTVTDILNQGPEGQVLYNGPGGLVDDADNLYYVAGNVGIGSTIPQYPLDVASNVRLQSGLYAGGSIGVAGQYLSATGTGITWSTFPILRTGLSTIATVGQTGFTTSYNVGFLDVFVNGVRLTGSEYVANNGSTITLNAPCFGGEAVDILAYGVISTASGIGGIGVGGSGGGPSYWIQNNTGINTSSNVGIGTTNAIEALTVSGNVSVTGVITASYFYGDGSNLTNLPVGGGSDSYWVKNITGIHTLGNIGVGTTTATSSAITIGSTTGISFNYKNVILGDEETGSSIIPDFDSFSGIWNNFIGVGAGKSTTTGSYNNFIGSLAGYYNSTGSYNNFFGCSAGQFNTNGSYNNFFGRLTGYSNATGCHNNFFGSVAGYYNATGCHNNFFGSCTGISTSASCKVIIGSGRPFQLFDSPDTTKDTQLAIGIRTDANPSKYWIVGNENFNVGIGTTIPNSKLTVEGDAYISGIVTALDFDSFSDINLKENIQTIKDPLDKVVKITGVTFNWKASGSPSVGVIAQDVEEVFPELVSGTDIKSLNYNGLVGLLIETIKEQQIQIDSLKNDVDELKSK